MTYRRAMNQVIALSIQESPVGAAAKLLLKTIFQQISLASVENYVSDKIKKHIKQFEICVRLNIFTEL